MRASLCVREDRIASTARLGSLSASATDPPQKKSLQDFNNDF
jgi:hypothetical protein